MEILSNKTMKVHLPRVPAVRGPEPRPGSEEASGLCPTPSPFPPQENMDSKEEPRVPSSFLGSEGEVEPPRRL